MANSKFYQFLYSKVPMLKMVQGFIPIGASGAVGTISGPGVSSVTKLATGVYAIQLVEPYTSFIGADFTLESGVTGSNVHDGSLVATTLYQITAVGNTSWSAVGLNSGLTPAVGQVFVATASGGSGTGTAKAITTSGLGSIEIAQVADSMLYTKPNAIAAGHGAIITIQTLDVSGALADPTSGCVIGFKVYFRDSSVTM